MSHLPIGFKICGGGCILSWFFPLALEENLGKVDDNHACLAREHY